MTVISTVPWWWARWLHLYWVSAALWRKLKAGRGGKKGQRLLSVASIVFAHWSLVERTPPGRPRRASKTFPKRISFLIFQSNFNGTRELYLEVFSVAVLWKMRFLWWGADGVPDLKPISRFQNYAADEDLEVAHYYCAYPEGSTKIIGAALDLRRRFDEFAPRAAALEPEGFAADYAKFLEQSQAAL